MDISEGHQELSVALAETIAVRFDASADWLLTGCADLSGSLSRR
ncbi:hypothetical protein [Klebsiella pneumoniae]|nr:hypothetical protein [Klebsiella pneumoniae]